MLCLNIDIMNFIIKSYTDVSGCRNSDNDGFRLSSRLISLRWYELAFNESPSVWKPLAGPLRNYPMVYCDAKTMNAKIDLLTVDEVFLTVANEVYHV